MLPPGVSMRRAWPLPLPPVSSVTKLKPCPTTHISSRPGFQTSLAIIPIVGQHVIVRGVTTIPFTAYSEGLLIKLACLRVNQPRSCLESDGTSIGALSTYQQARRDRNDSHPAHLAVARRVQLWQAAARSRPDGRVVQGSDAGLRYQAWLRLRRDPAYSSDRRPGCTAPP